MKRKAFSQRDYWNREASAFQKIYTHQKSKMGVLLDKFFRKDMYERFEFVLDKSEPIKGKRFLDVGCGCGYYCVALAKRGAETVVGIDISGKMLEAAKEAARSEGVENICAFIHSGLGDFEPASGFDVCLGIGLFDYIKEPWPVLKKMAGMAGEKVIVTFPRLWTWRAPVRKLRLIFKDCPVYFYTKGHIKKMMREAGIEDCEIKTIGKIYGVVGYT